MYSTIYSSRLYEQITEQIQKLVMDGSLRPGDKLPPERELAERFGVSRTAVREAVKALREKGLVEIQPGRGTFIINDASEAMRGSLGLIV
ncbi:MAG TPA: GntR family transcriptional regulator, partial [Anaerolineae bacterium]|nr:GntR family transcriptional regulator [Anaerolineae bacterium]